MQGVEGQVKTLRTDLLHNNVENFDQGAGIVVESNSAIRLFGDISRVFELSNTFEVQKFTRMKLTLEIMDDAAIQGVGLCFYDTFPSRSNQDRCFLAGTGGELDIDLGQIFYNKKTSVSHISIVMKLSSVQFTNTVEALVSTILVSPGEITDIVDENGQCTDPNAKTTRDGEEIFCLCADGYISSNGGKRQYELDSCVSCLLSPFCGFEGDSCTTSDDCFRGSCHDGRCEGLWVRISTLYPTFIYHLEIEN